MMLFALVVSMLKGILGYQTQIGEECQYDPFYWTPGCDDTTGDCTGYGTSIYYDHYGAPNGIYTTNYTLPQTQHCSLLL